MNFVCPNCGNNTFITTQKVIEEVVVDGDGNQVEVLKTVFFDRSENRQCAECYKHYRDERTLVSERYFHEFIAPKQVNTQGGKSQI